MAKKKTNKKLAKKDNKNVFIVVFLIILISILGIFLLLRDHQKNETFNTLTIPTSPKYIDYSNNNDSPEVTREPLEKITVYLSDGTETYGLVGKNWNNGKFAKVDVMLSNGAGNNQILKNVDGKWVSINLDISQNYLCAHFTSVGMTESDLNDLGIRQKNGVCSAWVSEGEYKDWNPNPDNFSE